MISYHGVIRGNCRGYATVDSENKDTFWITYVDWDLVSKLGKIIVFRNMPYPRHGVCDFDFIGPNWTEDEMMNI